MNLFEKLNRLDDSLVESKRVVKKKKLTESVKDVDKRKEFLKSVFTKWEILDLAEAHNDFTGRTYEEAFDYVLNNWDNFYFEDEYETFCEYEYDDDIDEMLTESTEQYELSTIVKDSINHLVNDLGKDPMADDFGDDVCADLENNYDIDIPQNPVKYADWCDAVMSEVSRQLNNKDEQLKEGYSNEITEFMNWIQDYRNGALWNDFTAEFEAEQDPNMDVVLNWLEMFDETAYYDYIQSDDNIDEMLTENRNNPYFAPYGYRDAAKVLNGKAPEYFYHLKEIEMDRGDGVKLARYAMRKGLPVMVDKNSDPDYPEFAIKGEYHWNDYFYPYPTAHEEDLVAWDGKMFVEESIVEEASEVYYLELFSNDGKTFEQSFSTYQEAEEEGNFSLKNNPMTKEYIIYDKNLKRVKHKR